MDTDYAPQSHSHTGGSTKQGHSTLNAGGRPSMEDASTYDEEFERALGEVIDLDYAKQLEDPNSPERKEADEYVARVGASGLLEDLKSAWADVEDADASLIEDPVKGIREGDPTQWLTLIEHLAGVPIFTIRTSDDGTGLPLAGKTETGDLLVSVFSRRSAAEAWLDSNPVSEFQVPVRSPMRDVFRCMENLRFGIYLNQSTPAVALSMPADVVDDVYNFAVHGSERVYQIKRQTGRFPQGRLS